MTPPASAEPTPSVTPPGSQPMPSCTALTQTGLDACASADLAQADARLKAVLDEVRGFYQPAQQSVLDQSEADWMTYRDTYCGILLLPTPAGSIAPTNVDNCKVLLDNERAKDVCSEVSPDAPLNALAYPFTQCDKVLGPTATAGP